MDRLLFLSDAESSRNQNSNILLVEKNNMIVVVFSILVITALVLARPDEESTFTKVQVEEFFQWMIRNGAITDSIAWPVSIPSFFSPPPGIDIID